MIKGAPPSTVLRLCLRNITVSEVANFFLLLHRSVKKRQSHRELILSHIYIKAESVWLSHVVKIRLINNTP